MTATQAETAETETVAVLGAGGTMGFPVAQHRQRRDAGALEVMASANWADGGNTGEPMAPQHPLWVQLSTIGEAATKRCAELANRAGVGFIDAPVLGTRQPAEEGKLVILESGPQEATPRTQPVSTPSH